MESGETQKDNNNNDDDDESNGISTPRTAVANQTEPTLVDLPADPTPNEALRDLPLFQETYEDMRQLIKMHASVATFRQSLLRLAGKKDQVTMVDIHRTLHQYEADLPADIPDRDKLLDCMRKHLWQSKKRDSIAELPALFLQDLRETLLDDTFEISYKAMQTSFQALLRSWSEAVLQVPTLVRLGYGVKDLQRSANLMNREQSNADQSVSSWGMDEQAEAEAKQNDEPWITVQRNNHNHNNNNNNNKSSITASTNTASRTTTNGYYNQNLRCLEQ